MSPLGKGPGAGAGLPRERGHCAWAVSTEGTRDGQRAAQAGRLLARTSAPALSEVGPEGAEQSSSVLSLSARGASGCRWEVQVGSQGAGGRRGREEQASVGAGVVGVAGLLLNVCLSKSDSEATGPPAGSRRRVQAGSITVGIITAQPARKQPSSQQTVLSLWAERPENSVLQPGLPGGCRPPLAWKPAHSPGPSLGEDERASVPPDSADLPSEPHSHPPFFPRAEPPARPLDAPGHCLSANFPGTQPGSGTTAAPARSLRLWAEATRGPPPRDLQPAAELAPGLDHWLLCPLRRSRDGAPRAFGALQRGPALPPTAHPVSGDHRCGHFLTTSAPSAWGAGHSGTLGAVHSLWGPPHAKSQAHACVSGTPHRPARGSGLPGFTS
uniref:Uncharacterized protein n=1 Tax=Rangifer tarandus platyrhynchus TaxID=3082113 RepID=A0ACB0EHX1_RANTA|nr:unnamed protein product [Rangifer tarandus platyrhynchus]